ncbi:MAG: lamin tail domain-containing protein [Gemmatimonadaceae bacterium]|nr:lamin tail domain-containing protein [Gemmatimonadaceae bacterium]
MSRRRSIFTRASSALLALSLFSACENIESTLQPIPAPALTTVTVSLSTTSITTGQTSTAAAVGLDQINSVISTGSVTWSTANVAIAIVDPATGVVTGRGAGTTNVIATAAGKTGQAAITVTAPPAIRINEVESNGGTPGDWIELFNPTSAAVNLAGWGLKDNDNTRTFQFPAGTTIAPGAYLVVEEAQFGYGLGAADSARLYNAFGAPVDVYGWNTHAIASYGRCPNGTGAFVEMTSVTKGVVNDCRPMIKINEVESNGGTPGDWIELFNAGTTTVDVSAFLVKDNDDTRTTRLPAGTTIAPGAFLIIEETTLGFGLGAADAARLFDTNGVLIDSYSWTAHASTTYGRCPDGSGGFTTTTVPTKNTANDCRAAIKINEVESNGGTPGDWIEIYNSGTAAIDVSGFIVKDNDDTRTTTLPAGTIIAPGAFYVVEEAVLGFGLGGADAARIFDTNGALLDSYTWTVHASITYGRCPDGTGEFASTTVSTKGAANSCSGGPPPASPWPGSDDVRAVDGTAVFGGNMSGLTYEATSGQPAVLWAARNGPGAIFRLIFSGGIWTPDPANGWGAGKLLRYTDSTGDADAEGLTFAGAGSSAGLYVSAERNNGANGVSRNSILRFDPSSAGTILRATHEWNLTSDLPVVGANAGVEAITWIPDSMLVANNFFDESKGRAYLPADYADHGTGLFFVGVEANGVIYAYALNHTTSGFTRVATITTGFPGVMGMEYDRATGYLWATCDDGCNNTTGILEIDVAAASATRGRFLAPRRYARPSTMPNLNNEGFAFAPNAECVGGRKPVFWADDSETGGRAIRQASITCGTVAPRATPATRALRQR